MKTLTIPLNWFCDSILSKNAGYQSDKEPDLHTDGAPVSPDVAMLILGVDRDEEYKVLNPLTEFNTTRTHRVYTKQHYLRHRKHWEDLQKKQKERAQASFERDQKIAGVAKFLQERWPNAFPDETKSMPMARTMVMEKNQAFLDALGAGITVDELLDSVTTDCEIVDKQWYAEEAKRKAMIKTSEEF